MASFNNNMYLQIIKNDYLDHEMYFWCIMVPNEKKYLEFRQTMINNQLRTLGTLAAIVYKRFHLGKIYNRK